MLIKTKFEGYARDGVRLFPMDGGGSSAPTSQTVSTTSIPEYAAPYVEKLLGKTEALTETPYQTYGGERQAGFTPLQQQAQQSAAGMTAAPQMAAASGIAALAGQQALGAKYAPTAAQNQFQGVGQYAPAQVGMYTAQAPNLQQHQMGPASQVGVQSFSAPGSSQTFMSPYMQNVVDIQQREAQRQADIAATRRGAAAVKQGAFGGSRAAIEAAEAARNLAQQKGDIQATGLQSAYQQAQAQFNAEQQARLIAQQANQQAGLTVGQQNLAARLGVQQLGAGQSLQAQLANQQAFQGAQSLAEQSRQFGAGQGLSAAQARAQYGQAAQQLAEQSRQYGAGLGLQGLQTATSAAGQLGTLGQQQFGQQTTINQLQQATGATQQAQQQQLLNQQYQDFLNQQNYPYKQLGFTSDMLRGLPLAQSSSQIYQQPPSMLNQVAGAGVAAKGLGLYAKGGAVGGRTAGLAALALSKMA